MMPKLKLTFLQLVLAIMHMGSINTIDKKDNKDNSNTDANLKKNRSNILFVQKNKIICLII